MLPDDLVGSVTNDVGAIVVIEVTFVVAVLFHLLFLLQFRPIGATVASRYYRQYP